MEPKAEKIAACCIDIESVAAGATMVVGPATPAISVASPLSNVCSAVTAADKAAGSTDNGIYRSSCCSKLADSSAEPTLSVGVWGPVYSRKANFPTDKVPDRKAPGDGRLRRFNVDADSFNKVLSADMAVSFCY